MAKGWVKVDRKIMEHWTWSSSDPFDIRSAWIDLILLANHEPGIIRENGEMVEIKRGQHKTSIDRLAARWNWSHGKVRRYLDDLEKDGMITRNSKPSGTLLTLVKYDFFQGQRQTNDTTNSTTNSTTDRPTNSTTDDRETRIIKNDIKNDKERKESAPLNSFGFPIEE